MVVTPLLDFLKPEHPGAPHLHHLSPPAAMPGGEIEIHGSHLGPFGGPPAADLPTVSIGDTPAAIALSRVDRATIRVPEGSISGDLVLHRNGSSSNPLFARIAVPMAENLHPVANPAVDADGRLFATFSGTRGQQVPVSIFAIDRDFQIRPFVRDLMNPTGLAFDRDGFLYASSRADGTIYRISSSGDAKLFAEGLGIATGIAFDTDGNLYVGDRSGTIFKIAARSGLPDPRNIYVFATLEPSMAAYHLAFNGAGTLFVTGPTTSSNQAIHAIAPDGTTTVFYHGLGRAQGMAFDIDDNLYVAASLHGRRGIVRITPRREASLAVSGSNLVGLAFLEDGCAALATRDALYHVALDIEGRKLA
jgi:sugar lactone lactonase YvrE